MPLRFQDSLTERDRPVVRGSAGPLRLYVCGPTVNDVAHVGHGRTYAYFDVIRRYFADRGVPVRHVMNITDFEDKISERAIRLGLSWRSLARREERRFKSDLLALKIWPPHLQPRASTFVPDMIRLIRRLERLGRVHAEGDSWYYRTPKPHDPRNFAIGAELTRHAVPEPGQPLEALDLLSRDFLVWRKQRAPAASWSSPWGAGAPGWHLECFTMAERHLGVPVDVHGGGQDLLFPHHYAENEIGLAVRDALFSRRFLHTAFVTENGRKMSKSKGNLVPLRAAIDRAGPDALRLYLHSLPYKVRLEWSNEELDRTASAHAELRRRSRASLEDGAGGSLSLARLRSLRARILHHLERSFEVDAAMREILGWSATVGAAGRGRFARGDRGTAREEYARIERLTGVAMV